MGFVHLHVHSAYSFLDGAQSPEQIAKTVASLGQKSVAITDHGVLHGLIKFSKACKDAGVRPILGLEAYMAPGSRLIKEKIDDLPPYYHLTLLAMDDVGLKNLYKLSTLGFTEGFYYKPRIDTEILDKYNEGIICLSGCLKGKIQQYLGQGKARQALDEARLMWEIFGDRFYLELQRIIPEQESIVQAQLEIAKITGYKCVATCDSHYSLRGQEDFHQQILCLSTGKTLLDPDKMRKMDNLYLKSEAEMRELFHDAPEAIDATEEVASRCQATFKTKYDYIFPTLTESKENDFALFDQESRAGLVKRGLAGDRRYVERLEYELQTIRDMGFPSYFLVVSDYVNWAKRNGIAVGPGRGSAAGSLVAYCLGITNIDPLKYDLLFQRFLNKSRVSLPDIDIDFDILRRSEVYDYITQRYGANKAAQITTFSEFQPRGAYRDFARVQGQPIALGEAASKLVPPINRGHNPTWEETLRASPQLLEGDFAELTRYARMSDGLIRQRGVHAGGVVISAGEFVEIAPLCTGKEDEVISQWDMEDLEYIGLVKMDILGVKQLTVISKAVRLIEQTCGTNIDIDNIPQDNDEVFDMICKGDTSGLFQLDGGGGIRDLCIGLRPRSIADISAISAMYRPGPLDGGVTAAFLERTKDPSKVEYLVPQLEPVLNETKGLLIYQEQAMRIATDLAGFTLEEADTLRKAIGKKKREEMAKLEKKLVEGMSKKGISPSDANTIWEQIKSFADYGFNKSHAVAYSFVTYQEAWLKCHYPIQFFCALLAMHMDERDKLIEYIGECRRKDIQILPPDVNESDVEFSVFNGTIRFGLAAIKGIGEKVSASIVEARKGKPFVDIFDFYERTREVGVNKKVIECLAKAGALASLNIPRAGVLTLLDDLVGFKKEQEKYASKMETYKRKVLKYNERRHENDEAVKAGMKPKGELTKPIEPEPPKPLTIPDVQELDLDVILTMEKESIGFYVTSHPLYEYEREIMRLTDAHTGSLKDNCHGEHVTLLGVVAAARHFTTRAGKKMAVIDLEDLHGHIEVAIFSRLYEKVSSHLVDGTVVLLNGKVEAGEEEGTRKLIAEDVKVLPKKVKKVVPVVPKKISLLVTNPTQDTIDKIREVIAICPGSIELSVKITLGQYSYRLEGCKSISMEAVRCFKDIQNIVLEQAHEKGACL